ncbi:hypothetical protein JOM56_007127 [Amanita muscaria]
MKHRGRRIRPGRRDDLELGRRMKGRSGGYAKDQSIRTSSWTMVHGRCDVLGCNDTGTHIPAPKFDVVRCPTQEVYIYVPRLEESHELLPASGQRKDPRHHASYSTCAPALFFSHFWMRERCNGTSRSRTPCRYLHLGFRLLLLALPSRPMERHWQLYQSEPSKSWVYTEFSDYLSQRLRPTLQPRRTVLQCSREDTVAPVLSRRAALHAPKGTHLRSSSASIGAMGHHDHAESYSVLSTVHSLLRKQSTIEAIPRQEFNSTTFSTLIGIAPHRQHR